jgi:small basic protein
VSSRYPGGEIPQINCELQIYITIFIIATCSGVFGTIFRLHLKNKVASIFSMIYILGIYMTYSIVFSASSKPINLQQANVFYAIKYIVFPSLTLVITCGLARFGFVLNKKEDIRI